MFHNRNRIFVDPVERAYTRYFRRLLTYAVMLAVGVGIMCIVGVPHLQWTYTYTGERPSHGWVHGRQKLDAWYFGPSGWQHVESGEYGQVGCPAVVLIPVQDCWSANVSLQLP
jgi:hypothetical protein